MTTAVLKQACALIIFIKNPIAGKVKTRIARQVGDKKALSIYLSLLNHTRQVCASIELDKFLYYSDFIADDEWDNDSFKKRLQNGGDLGERMYNAFNDSLAMYDKVLIIGSDCPQITSEIIRQGFDKLNDAELVIGPSPDGGYYLLGLKADHPELFDQISWSSSEVFSQTLNRASVKGLRVALLPELSDVDYFEDWIQYGWPEK